MRRVRLAAFLLLAGCAHQPPVAAPGSDASLSARLAPVQSVLDSAIRAGAAPGAVLSVSARGQHALMVTGAIGVRDPAPVTISTIYDLASLTKVVALTTLAMMAVEDGKLDLDKPVVTYLPEFAVGNGGKSQVTVRDLLLHDSGLPAGRPLWQETRTRTQAIARTLSTDLTAPPETRMLYSDLGAITLTAIIEKLYHKRIDRLFAERVTTPLGLTSMRYLPPKGWLKSIAPTENDPWRGREVRGEVHDENTVRMDGVSGHAGLFTNAVDLRTFGEWALAGANGSRSMKALQPPQLFATWTTRQNIPAGSSRAIGWDTPSGNASSAGRYMSSQSFGHTGFTGTSIWIDPVNEVVVVLLTNRVNPTRTTPAFGNFRGAVTDAVMQALGVTTPRQ